MEDYNHDVIKSLNVSPTNAELEAKAEEEKKKKKKNKKKALDSDSDVEIIAQKRGGRDEDLKEASQGEESDASANQVYYEADEIDATKRNQQIDPFSDL